MYTAEKKYQPMTLLIRILKIKKCKSFPFFIIIKLSVKFNKISVYKYFYYCVHMCKLSILCHGE